MRRTVLFMLRLSPELKRELLRRARVRGVTAAELLRQALREHLERTEQSARYRWGG